MNRPGGAVDLQAEGLMRKTTRERDSMRIETLSAEDFRNIDSQSVSFSPGVNLLYGSNGAGKTNLLEAVYLFAICKSHRTVKDGDFVAHGKPGAKLSMTFSSDTDRGVLPPVPPRHMEILYFPNGKKHMRYEGVSVSKVSEFVGLFRAVLFTPDHLSLIKGAPEERRKFCDMALSQIRPGYIRYLNEYYRILQQRNALLKGFRDTGTGDKALLSVYSEALSGAAAVITRQRAAFACYLEEQAQKFYRDISGGAEKLYIRYYGGAREEDASEEALRNRFYRLYTENTDTEIRQGSTKYGPHRDDMLVFLEKAPEEPLREEEASSDYAEYAARTFASQGQQRSAVLALKLAEGEIIRTLTGEYPVYLFDDVLSELDRERRDRFLSLFQDKQVLLTCCDGTAAKETAGRKLFVEKGTYRITG